jgi:hypothetical protein
MQTFTFTANGQTYTITAATYQEARAQLAELMAAE